jgi:hypothetical protein
MERVEISPVAVLEAMMKELRLPGPEYIHDVAAWDSFTTKVVFFPSIQLCTLQRNLTHCTVTRQ